MGNVILIFLLSVWILIISANLSNETERVDALEKKIAECVKWIK